MTTKAKSSPHKNLFRNLREKKVVMSLMRRGFLFVRTFPVKDGAWEAAETEALAERDLLNRLLEGRNDEQILQLLNTFQQENTRRAEIARLTRPRKERKYTPVKRPPADTIMVSYAEAARRLRAEHPEFAYTALQLRRLCNRGHLPGGINHPGQGLVRRVFGHVNYEMLVKALSSRLTPAIPHSHA